MSMLIKGINPPKSCYTCDWYNKVQCPVDVSKCHYKIARHPSCPLIEVPTPHGRLADLDQIIDEFWDGYYMRIGARDLEEISSKTVIEAEE